MRQNRQELKYLPLRPLSITAALSLTNEAFLEVRLSTVSWRAFTLDLSLSFSPCRREFSWNISLMDSTPSGPTILLPCKRRGEIIKSNHCKQLHSLVPWQAAFSLDCPLTSSCAWTSFSLRTLSYVYKNPNFDTTKVLTEQLHNISNKQIVTESLKDYIFTALNPLYLNYFK